MYIQPIETPFYNTGKSRLSKVKIKVRDPQQRGKDYEQLIVSGTARPAGRCMWLYLFVFWNGGQAAYGIDIG